MQTQPNPDKIRFVELIQVIVHSSHPIVAGFLMICSYGNFMNASRTLVAAFDFRGHFHAIEEY